MPKTLYVFDTHGELHTISRDEKGKLHVSYGDDLPDFEESDTVAVFEGEVIDVRGWTEEQCDEADVPLAALECDEWWKGAMRPASVAEISAVLAPENDPRFQRLPLPETSGLICDEFGVVPADAIRTLGEYDMLHTEALDSLRAVLRSHDVINARLEQVHAMATRFIDEGQLGGTSLALDMLSIVGSEAHPMTRPASRGGV